MMKLTNTDKTNEIKKTVKNFDCNYVMESNTHYILYGKEQRGGKGNKCSTVRLSKDLFS